MTMDLLAPFNLNKVAVARSLSETGCAKYDVSKVTMEEAFENACIISNHLHDHEDNKGVINYDLLVKMRYGVTIFNETTLFKYDLGFLNVNFG